MRPTASAASVLGAPSGHPFADGRPVHVHFGPTVPGHPSCALGGLDVADQISAASRFGRVRVSGVHDAAHESLHTPERHR